MNEKLDDSTFLQYAADNYDNPQCFDIIEFQEDLKKFKYIKRLFNRYINDGELSERLILNHIISLNNVFRPEHATRMLFFKLQGYEAYLAPFLVLLNTLPYEIYNIGHSEIIRCYDIDMDQKIVEKLKEI